MNEEITKSKSLFKSKGFLIALGACVLAAGGAGVAAYNHSMNKISKNIYSTTADSSKSNVAVNNLTSSLPMNESSKSESSTTDSAVQTQPNVMPVNGEIIKPFSNGELVKSETLGVWKTHDGVDIKAAAGTQVKSMNHGTVTKVWEDPLWGNCVIIDHGNGVEGYYYNLSKGITVIEGDTVDSGDVIGAVGDTATIEAAEPSHLHFALKRNGKWIDPISYINPSADK
ncbi:MAG: peptidoglycan DD-metalloendopeptidase family protein [Oscillospiraceae bacterium]